MKLQYIFPLLLIAAIFTACTEHGDFERRLAVADSLMTHELPDSAYRMLCGMNEEAEHMPDAQRMRHLLLRSNAQNKAYVDFTSDSIGCLLVDYYMAHGTSNERMLAHYIKGCAYRDMGDQPASLRCYNDAVAAADTSATDCNYDQLCIIYGQIADIFNRRAMPDNALQAYEYAERYAWIAKDTIKVFTFWGNKANALLNQGKIKEALRIKETAAEGFHAMGYPQKAARTLGACIKWYIKEGRFDKAYSAMNEYENHSGYFTSKTHTDVKRTGYNYTKGLYYLGTGKLDSAEYFFRKLLHDGTTINDKYLAAWGITQLYYNKEQMDSVGKYALQTFLHSDTLYNIEVAENLQNAQAMYNYDRHQEKALRKEMEAKEARIRFYQITLGVVLLAILSVLLYRKYLRHKMQLLIRRAQNELTAHTNTINQLKEQIQEKAELIHSLNKQLSQHALNITENEQLKQTIAILEDKIEKDKQDIDRLTSRGSLHQLRSKSVITRFIQMAQQGDVRPDKEMWEQVISQVEACYPNIISLKQNKDINKNEYRLCILIKIGLRISEIVFVENTSNANISNMRRRMSKKLGIGGGAKDFDRWLEKI